MSLEEWKAAFGALKVWMKQQKEKHAAQGGVQSAQPASTPPSVEMTQGAPPMAAGQPPPPQPLPQYAQAPSPPPQPQYAQAPPQQQPQYAPQQPQYAPPPQQYAPPPQQPQVVQQRVAYAPAAQVGYAAPAPMGYAAPARPQVVYAQQPQVVHMHHGGGAYGRRAGYSSYGGGGMGVGGGLAGGLLAGMMFSSIFK